MSCCKVEVGEKYGYLTVIEKTEKRGKSGQVYWNCLCSCGNSKEVCSSNLTSGHTKSCGCYAIEKSQQRMKEKWRTYLSLKKTREINKNETILRNNHIVMICSGKKVLLDYEDYLSISNERWFVSNGYCYNSGGQSLHRKIMNAEKGQVIDHINGNKLDNRKINLRFVTKSQNGQNRKCKGITYDKERKKWCANIVVNGKRHYLGRYDTEDEALLARKNGEIKYQGEYRYNGN